jgi:flagellar basal-body rod protein FlgB
VKLFFEKLFGSTVGALEKTLDLTWSRNQAITSNIANAETPHYRAVDMSFGDTLEKAFSKPGSSDQLLRTHVDHLDVSGSSGPNLAEDTSGATKADGNNVDIDIQMGRLAYNSGKYSLAANLMRKELSTVSNAIRLVG